MLIENWKMVMEEKFVRFKSFQQQVIINESSSYYKLAKFDDMLKRKGILDRKERRLMCHIFWWSMEEDFAHFNVVIKQQSKSIRKFIKKFFFTHFVYRLCFRFSAKSMTLVLNILFRIELIDPILKLRHIYTFFVKQYKVCSLD